MIYVPIKKNKFKYISLIWQHFDKKNYFKLSLIFLK